MVQSALALGPAFQKISVSIAKGRPLRFAGVLRAEPALEEMPVVSAPANRRSLQKSGAIRAFRVRGEELNNDGLFDGDYVLVSDQSRPRAGAVVLVEQQGRPVLQRATMPRPSSSKGTSQDGSRVVGVFLGIIRKRGFGGTTERKPPLPISRAQWTENLPSGPPTKVTLLRGQLGMLESTCADTKNPRLQRALRNEADRVRRQLQNETPLN